MEEKDILKRLQVLYPDLISPIDKFPQAYKGNNKIKAIILGADPTHIVDSHPKPLEFVFQIENPNSPYWKGIKQNLERITGMTQEHVYVQNVCRNYFNLETSKNKVWVEIARQYWIPFLAKELDVMFDKSVPILMTTEFILKAALNSGESNIKAKNIYNVCITIDSGKNLFGRELIAFYRHPAYSISKHENYKLFIERRLKMV
jgi:hypothetical protein